MEDLKNMMMLAGKFLGLVSQVAAIFEDSRNATGPTKKIGVMSSAQDIVNATKFGPKPSNMNFQPGTSNVSKPANVKITINAPNVSGTAVLDALKQKAKTVGIPMSKLLG
jgi:hypothetical protein